MASRREVLAAKKARLKERTGHELLEPANQYCKHCGEAMFTNAAFSKCKGSRENINTSRE